MSQPLFHAESYPFGLPLTANDGQQPLQPYRLYAESTSYGLKMADPLSITASIIAVIQITGKVISLCYDYRASLKNAPKEIKQLTDEIVSLRDILEHVLKLVEAEDEASTQLSVLKVLTKADGLLLKCRTEMTALDNDLKPATGIRGAVRSLKWPFAKAETEKRVERLGWLKSSLTLALATDNM